ncbi:MAG: [ribosomal protein S18]-alanine N-acetyltransferase [Pseudomonadota bacterium]|nr:[ribosomal protein S18]-alanine N-acetyltransferase [Pseudomonadota bacterium]
MQIRLAKNSEITTLSQLDHEASLTPWSTDNYLSSLNNHNHFIYVLLESGTIIGCLIVSKSLDEAEILQFWICPRHRRKGLGCHLLDFVLQWLRNKHRVNLVFLEVREGNQQAINLYLKLGFSQVGQRKNYYKVDNWQFDALIMQKYL